MAVYGNSREAFTDKDGNPIQGGTLYIGEPDQDPVANPKTITDLDDNVISSGVVLDSLGVPSIAFKVSGDFSQAVYDSTAVEVISYQIKRAAGFLTEGDISGITTQGAPWVSSRTYNTPDFVSGSDGNYYTTLTNNNLGNDPTASPTAWSRLAWPTLFNVAETYDIDDCCVGSDGLTYRSNVDSNVNNDPVLDAGVNWTPPSGQVLVTVITATDAAWPSVAGAKSITFELSGSGGGGGSCNHSGSGRGASIGGAGGAKTSNTVNGGNIETTYSITIGIGGIGGVGSDVAGADGTDSSISSVNINTTAGGGDGGTGSSAPAGTLRNLPAAGGVASGDGFLLNGNSSTDGIINSGVIASTSNSGTSTYGGTVSSQEDADGLNGVNPGSGGGGAHTTSGAGSNRDGGSGSDGVCVITQYF